MAVITISRQFGAGGRTLGEMLAKQLDYRFLDDCIIQEISKKAKVSKNMVISMERTAGGSLSKFISGLLSRSYMDRLTGDERGYMDEEIYVETLQEVMLKLAKEDNVILMGRGGQYILEDFKGAFHFLLVSNLKDRINFMQRYYDLSNAKAEAAVKRGEKKRENLYQKIKKKDYNQPEHYHLVLNTSIISLEQAVKAICTLL